MMKRALYLNYLVVVFSAVLTYLAIKTASFTLTWLCLVPLFIATIGKSIKQHALLGTIWGASFAAVMLTWLPILVKDFTAEWWPGITVFLLCILSAAFLFGIVFFASSKIFSKMTWVLRAVVISSLWSLAEFVYSTYLPGMPWFAIFRISNGILNNLFAIQYASYGGGFILTFVVVFVNYLIAFFIAEKKWKQLFIPLAVIVAYLLGGWGLFQYYQELNQSKSKIAIAIVRDNTAPQFKWNEQNGAQMVETLFALNKKANATKPDLVLWSESVVPWTYRADDDFISQLLKQSVNANLQHVIGLTTDFDDRFIYNSAYCIDADGKVLGRYDKRFPVSIAEKPMAGFYVPIMGNSERILEQSGENVEPIPTKNGKMGVLICNDATVPGSANEIAANGAEFFVSVSNDAWLEKVPFFVQQHFYNTRLRAVEVRKPFAINCNRGVSGAVDANGVILAKYDDERVEVKKVEINGNNFLSLYSAYPYLFALVMVVGVLIIVLFKQKLSR